MATGISWADETWNPFVGCKPVSPACVNCYAQDMAARLVMMAASKGALSHYATTVRPTEKGPQWTGHIARAGLDARFAPLKWGRPRDIFTGSMTDFFHAGAPDEWRIEALAVMALTPRHRYLLLTKRAGDMRRFMTAPATEKAVWQKAAAIAIERDLCLTRIEDMVVGAWPLPNVALGVTAEDQRRAEERIPDLLATPAAMRWASCEPLLGPINLFSNKGGTLWLGGQRGCDGTHRHSGDPISHSHCGSEPYYGDPRYFHHHHDERCGPGLDWVIAGGESGKNARPTHPDWVRALRDQCAEAGVPFHFKQWGEWHTKACRISSGEAVFRTFDTFQQWVAKASTWVNGGICLDRTGRNLEIGADFMRARDEGTFPVTIMHRVGVHRAGHLLDGVEHRARLPHRSKPSF